jgi:hypothetical protein
MIKKKDKEKAKKEASAQERMINTIRKREEKALHRIGVTARRCERLRKEVLEDGNILLDNRGIRAFLEVIIDPEEQAILAAAQPMTLPSSPLIRLLDS